MKRTRAALSARRLPPPGIVHKGVRVLALFLFTFSIARALTCEELEWNANADTSTAGYSVSYGTSSGNYTSTVDAGTATTATLPNLAFATTYYAVVTGVNALSCPGPSSSEIVFTTAPRPPPQISLTSPMDDSTYVAPASVALEATATDSDGAVVLVEFFNAGTKIGQSTSAPYTMTSSDLGPGTYQITARATDDQGATATSCEVDFTVVMRVPASIDGLSYSLASGLVLTATASTSVNELLFSPNLATWNPLVTVPAAGGTFQITPPGPISESAPVGFYKITNSDGTNDTVGYMNLTIAGAARRGEIAYSYLGICLANPVTDQGTVASAGIRTIVDAEPAWSDSQLDAVGSAYFVEITSGPHSGVHSDIVSSTVATGTLQLSSDLSGELSGGESYVVRKHRTIGDIFGLQDESGLVGGATPASADEVRLFNPAKQTFSNYFYKTSGLGGIGWRATPRGLEDASSTPVNGDFGVIVVRRAPGTLNLTLTGFVEAVPVVFPIGPRQNLVCTHAAWGGLTLENSGLYTGNQASGLGGGPSIGPADEVRLFAGGTFRNYYYKTAGSGGTGWRESTNSLIDASTTELPAGSSFLIVRKQIRGAFIWTIPQQH